MSGTPSAVSSTDFSTKVAQLYDDVTTSRPWRHTIGRVSCAIRLPFYALAVIFQVAKMGIKFLPACLITPIAWGLGTRKLESWTFNGIGLDGVVALKFLDKIGSSVIGVICAPPKKYHSILEALKSVGKFSILGQHQDAWKEGANMNVPPKLGDLAFHILCPRAAYSKIIIQQDKIYDMKPGCYGFYKHMKTENLEKIKSA